MSGAPTRVYVARLAGLPVYDPQGDQVGKVRDVVVSLRADTARRRVLGLVLEVFGRRKVFLPIGRVTSIDTGQVISTGLVNMRRFEQRPGEALVLGELLDRTVRIPGSDVDITYDKAHGAMRVRADELSITFTFYTHEGKPIDSLTLPAHP